MEKILIEIFGNKNAAALSACSCKSNEDKACNSSSHNCKNCSSHSCGNSSSSKHTNTVYEIYLEISTYLKNSDIGKFVDTKFIDTDSEDMSTYENIKSLLQQNFEPPITVIDGIVRYNGGIMASLIYKDAKELLEEYYHVDLSSGNK